MGGVASISTLQTTFTVGLITALVGAIAGPDGVAGYGTGARLEYLLVPLVFGLGAPLVALVGTNIGAGQRERALRIALTGGAVSFALTEVIGITAALWPEAWLGLFGHDLIARSRVLRRERDHILLTQVGDGSRQNGLDALTDAHFASDLGGHRCIRRLAQILHALR